MLLAPCEFDHAAKDESKARRGQAVNKSMPNKKQKPVDEFENAKKDAEAWRKTQDEAVGLFSHLDYLKRIKDRGCGHM